MSKGIKINRTWEIVYFTKKGLSVELTINREEKTVQLCSKHEDSFKFNPNVNKAIIEAELICFALQWAKKQKL